MKRKQVKQLLKEHPDFKAWVMQDITRSSDLKANPASASEWFKRWNDRKSKGIVDFDGISQKTKRATEMLTSVHSIMEMMADYSKKQKESQEG